MACTRLPLFSAAAFGLTNADGEGKAGEDEIACFVLPRRLGGVMVGRRLEFGEEELMTTGLAMVRRTARTHRDIFESARNASDVSALA